MKQILQNVRSGELSLAELPAPVAERGQVLVRNAFSVMSPGTEKLALDFARKSLLGKARSRPDLVRQVVDKLRKEGPLPTYRAVTTRLEGPQPLGYSSAGVVLETGSGVTRFEPGDRVACAGAGYANHAELVAVPENLVVRVPDAVDLEKAAFATLGAIALQGVRVGSPSMGEVAAVVGLGLIGQLTVQLLAANGCRVLGVDLDERRLGEARACGTAWTGLPTDDWEAWRRAETDGHGADLVVVTASSSSAEPLRLGAELCRMKGRLVLVGAVPVELERRVLYEKELELRLSMSYGPGRYDRRYEEEGLDYPLPFVRWTENRNLEAFLHLAAAGRVDPGLLPTETVPFEEALTVYEDLAAGRRHSLAALFRYADAPSTARTLQLRAGPAKKDEIGIAFLGAGNYARSVLIPALPAGALQRRWLVTTRGATALSTAERHGFASCGTDPGAPLEDPDVGLVFVATRHDSHAELAARALRAGKAVWLEKPMALDPEQLAELESAARESGGFLSVGYNRRFSRHARAAREALSSRRGPLSLHYTVAAGPRPAGTWITDPAVGGGRIVGEVCHFVDLCTYLVGGPPQGVYARGPEARSELDDSTSVTLDFADGSVATIAYLSRGSSVLPKERFEASADGVTVQCDNFRETRILASGARTVKTLNQDKGQRTAVHEVIEAVRRGQPSPFELEELLATSRATFAILASARSGRREEI